MLISITSLLETFLVGNLIGFIGAIYLMRKFDKWKNNIPKKD